jgi:hypothetical protein
MTTSSDGKPYSITFELRSDYLYAYVKGDSDSYDISHAYWTEVSEECAKRGVRKLLVDEDLAEPMPSMSEIFQGAAERSFMGLSGLKIAFVDRHPEQHQQNLFGELVATNRGLFCKVFESLDEGEDWLVSEHG